MSGRAQPRENLALGLATTTPLSDETRLLERLVYLIAIDPRMP